MNYNRDLIQRAQMGYLKNAENSYLDLTQGLSTNPQVMNTPVQGAVNASWLEKSVTNKYQSPPSQSQFNFGKSGNPDLVNMTSGIASSDPADSEISRVLPANILNKSIFGAGPAK